MNHYEHRSFLSRENLYLCVSKCLGHLLPALFVIVRLCLPRIEVAALVAFGTLIMKLEECPSVASSCGNWFRLFPLQGEQTQNRLREGLRLKRREHYKWNRRLSEGGGREYCRKPWYVQVPTTKIRRIFLWGCIQRFFEFEGRGVDPLTQEIDDNTAVWSIDVKSQNFVVEHEPGAWKDLKGERKTRLNWVFCWGADGSGPL